METTSSKPSKESQSDLLLPADSVLPQSLFLLPIQTSPVYPGMVAPLILTRPKLIETINNVIENRGIVGLVLTRENADGDSQPDNIYNFGVAARVIKKINVADGAVTVLIHSLKRFEIKKIVREEPCKVAQVEYKNDIYKKSVELDALIRSVVSQVKTLSETNPFFTEEIKQALLNAPGPAGLADLIAFSLSLKREDAQELLETFDVKTRFEKILFHLKREQELSEIQKKINEDVSKKIQNMQREFFLKEQLRSIRRELGGGEEASTSLVDRYRERLEKMKFSEAAKKVANDEIDKLESTAETSPEHNVIRNYLDWMFALPWDEFTTDNLEIKHARKVLEEDHYGITKVKERILEFLAVRKLNPKAKGSILCLVGPPGVGKTSLGRSIAKAMNRKFFRISLGGLRDEAEIRGHRRTYIGAMPGKVLAAIKRAGSQNPVIVMDEVDKLGSSFQGDPASALLEVLDPEQNKDFVDHYLDVPFDLSNVLFILTANQTASIPEPLLDRMELIELNGYTLEEKAEIAKRHVIPKEIENHGLKPDQLQIPSATLDAVMLQYCREPGMRSLQQKVAQISRKVASKVVENPNLRSVTVRPKDLYDYLGTERFTGNEFLKPQSPGSALGLAWTPMGGEVLTIEASGVPKMTGKRGKKKDEDSAFSAMKITGQLGEVMGESAAIAYSYVKKRTKNDKDAQKFFGDNEVHLHIPAGAIPKDGPSAGITMATALMSLAKNKRIKDGIAMTGELSLLGRVLPVGGVKEKVLAAKRNEITTLILPKKNKKDLREIPASNLRGLKFHFVDRVEEVFKLAL